jgi:hypothetical protein
MEAIATMIERMEVTAVLFPKKGSQQNPVLYRQFIPGQTTLPSQPVDTHDDYPSEEALATAQLCE